MLGFLRKKHAGPVPGTDSTEYKQASREYPRPEAEVDFIMKLLEKKLGTPFTRRVKLDGYIDEPEYRLVVNNYASAKTGQFVAIFGGGSKNVLDISTKFLEKYWADSEKYSNADVSRMDSFDRSIYEDWKRAEVAGSREELILLMETEAAA